MGSKFGSAIFLDYSDNYILQKNKNLTGSWMNIGMNFNYERYGMF